MRILQITPIEGELQFAVLHYQQDLNGQTITHQIYEKLSAWALIEDEHGGDSVVGVLEVDEETAPYPTLIPEIEGDKIRCVGYASKTVLDLRGAVLYEDRLKDGE